MESRIRNEIQGLRAIAVLLVMLCHAGMPGFSAGYVGVDIFFVISGFIITLTTIRDLDGDNFSFAKFYERRARRILPALYVVMVVSCITGYFVLMPDDYKGLGQSVVATALSANNILLLKTVGYWDSSSEFKPLLHTWSLGVEEQFYLAFPLLVFLSTRLNRQRINLVVLFVSSLSLTLGIALNSEYPNAVFYLIPMRAWELLLGVSLALNERFHSQRLSQNARSVMAIFGGGLLLVSLVVVPATTEGHGFVMLVIPALAAALLAAFATSAPLIQKFLSQQSLVFIGTISYSLYLWHQPILAFARSWSVQPIGVLGASCLIIICFPIAYWSWKYIEQPLRNPAVIRRLPLLVSALVFTIALVALGAYLNFSYGVLSRLDDRSTAIGDLDKRIYNEGAFRFKRDQFLQRSKPRVLVIGNSFGRDFVNMLSETYRASAPEIVYRDDMRDCINKSQFDDDKELLAAANIIVIASNMTYSSCVAENIEIVRKQGKQLFYVGTKDFGANLNWLIRLSRPARANQRNEMTKSALLINAAMVRQIPEENFISIIQPTIDGNMIPVTNESGQPLSTDRVHLTKFGAQYFGERVLKIGSFQRALEGESSKKIP